MLLSSQTWVMPSLVPSRPFTLRSIVMGSLSELDLDVDAGREVEAHQGVNGLRGGVDDVDEALVGPHLEVLAGVLVLVGRADHAVHVLLGRQRHRAGDLRTRAGDGVHDLARRGVDHLVVIGLEPDADLLSRHRSLSSFVSSRWSCPVVLRHSPHRRPPRSGVSSWSGDARLRAGGGWVARRRTSSGSGLPQQAWGAVRPHAGHLHTSGDAIQWSRTAAPRRPAGATGLSWQTLRPRPNSPPPAGETLRFVCVAKRGKTRETTDESGAGQGQRGRTRSVFALHGPQRSALRALTFTKYLPAGSLKRNLCRPAPTTWASTLLPSFSNTATL